MAEVWISAMLIQSPIFVDIFWISEINRIPNKCGYHIYPVESFESTDITGLISKKLADTNSLIPPTYRHQPFYWLQKNTPESCRCDIIIQADER